MPAYTYRLAETSPPGAEPLTLDEAKAHLRVEHDAEDAFITGLIAAARQFCEDFTGRALITRGYSLYMDAWPEGPVCLPRPPLVSVTRIDVYAADNTATEFSAGNYMVETAGNAGRVALNAGVSPPAPGRDFSGVEIQYRAGYGPAPQHVPAALRQGMRQMLAHLYENRGDRPDGALHASGAAALFRSFRVMAL